MGSVSFSHVGPVSARFRYIEIVGVTMSIMIVFMVAYLVKQVAWLAFVLVIPIIAAFGIT